MEQPVAVCAGEDQWVDGCTEGDARRETTHAGFGTYDVRLPGIAAWRHGLALHVTQLHRRKDDGGAGVGTRTATGQRGTEWTPAEQQAHLSPLPTGGEF